MATKSNDRATRGLGSRVYRSPAHAVILRSNPWAALKQTLYAATAVALLTLRPAAFSAEAVQAKPDERLPSIVKKTAEMQHMPGLLPLHWDDNSGHLHLEIPLLNVDLLYLESLPYGMGSADLGLDRGEMLGSQIVRFERIGPKVLLVQPNEEFRASSAYPSERLSVRQSFPESVLAAFDI